jgi:hypothetical protein
MHYASVQQGNHNGAEERNRHEYSGSKRSEDASIQGRAATVAADQSRALIWGFRTCWPMNGVCQANIRVQSTKLVRNKASSR